MQWVVDSKSKNYQDENSIYKLASKIPVEVVEMQMSPVVKQLGMLPSALQQSIYTQFALISPTLYFGNQKKFADYPVELVRLALQGYYIFCDPIAKKDNSLYLIAVQSKHVEKILPGSFNSGGDYHVNTGSININGTP